MSKVGRNDPCPCGSGRKYKKCHPGEYDSVVGQLGPISDIPVISCAINDDFRDLGLATVVVVRGQPGVSTFVISTFVCDIFCLGIKDVAFYPRATTATLSKFMERMPLNFEDIPYDAARNLVFGCVEYAKSLGFEPHPEFDYIKETLEPDLPYDASMFEYGQRGRPLYVTGPDDNYDKIFATLEASCGKGNFDYHIDSRAKYIYPKP
jgi:hypothetical protein